MKTKLLNIFKLKFNYPFGKQTWFGSGGRCTLFFKIKSINQLKLIMRLSNFTLPTFVIGCGSNLLVRDGGFRGIVIKLIGDFLKINFDDEKSILTLGSGVKDYEVSKFCLKNCITGFEFLSGIPGTIGGNLKMNAGCFGKTISDDLIDCTLLNENLKIITLSRDQINFNYRKSSIKDNNIIISARFRIRKSNKIKIKENLSKILHQRRTTQPIGNRTGGSTFTNPPNFSAWNLIDGVKFKGKKIGGAKVSEKHSNFLINENSATSLDIELLGEEIREKVLEKFNIKLDWELQKIGEFKKI